MAPFTDHQTVLLETRKRDGTWVTTPVSLVVDGDRAYFRTFDAAGKFKRLRNFPEVRVTPSTFFAKPIGPTVEGRAQLVDGDDAEHARALLTSFYPLLHGRLVPWMHRRKGWQTVHFELTLDD